MKDWFSPAGDPYEYKFLDGGRMLTKRKGASDETAKQILVNDVMKFNPNWMEQESVKQNYAHKVGVADMEGVVARGPEVSTDAPLVRLRQPSAAPTGGYAPDASSVVGSAPSPAVAGTSPYDVDLPEGDLDVVGVPVQAAPDRIGAGFVPGQYSPDYYGGMVPVPPGWEGPTNTRTRQPGQRSVIVPRRTMAQSPATGGGNYAIQEMTKKAKAATGPLDGLMMMPGKIVAGIRDKIRNR